MTLRELLPAQQIADQNGNPSREFVEIIQRLVRRVTYLEGQTVGLGQTWQTVTRAHSTSYQNTTGRAIGVSITARSTTTTSRDIQASTDNAAWVTVGRTSTSAVGFLTGVSFVLPAGHYYRVNGATDFLVAAELA